MLFFRTLLTFWKDEEYRDLLGTTMIILGLGTIVYHYLEGWPWLDCVYFCVITLTTIGYGDFAPQTIGGKVFTIFYIAIGIGIILSFINTIYKHYAMEKKKEVNVKAKNNKPKSDKRIEI